MKYLTEKQALEKYGSRLNQMVLISELYSIASALWNCKDTSDQITLAKIKNECEAIGASQEEVEEILKNPVFRIERYGLTFYIVADDSE